MLVVFSSLIILRREIYHKEKIPSQLDMSKIPKYWNSAKKYLSKKDKVMSFN